MLDVCVWERVEEREDPYASVGIAFPGAEGVARVVARETPIAARRNVHSRRIWRKQRRLYWRFGS